MPDETLVSPPEENRQSETTSGIYTAFGLTISSCIPCKELIPQTGAPDVDVTVVYGHVPLDLPGGKQIHAGCKALPGQLLLDVPSVARFLIRDGHEVIVHRHDGATDDDVRLCLLGSALGAIMHQRGILVLNGSSVQVDDGCAVFLGDTGLGKSTLATELSRRGYLCVGDDVCAISIGSDGVPYAAPGYPQAKLRIDSLEYFGVDAAKPRRVPPSREKHYLPIERYTRETRIPVKWLYVLNRGTHQHSELLIRPVKGTVKIRVLRDYTYRVAFLRGLDLAPHHFKQIAHIAARLPVTRIIRPPTEFAVEQVASAVEGHFALAREADY